MFNYQLRLQMLQYVSKGETMKLQRSRVIENLTKALSKSHKELKSFNVDKAGYNFKYLTLSAIYEKALPVLSSNGLAISSKNHVFVRDSMPWVQVTTTLYWGNEFISNEMSFPLIEPSKKTDTDIMMLGSTISYLTRYNVQTLLSISGSDKDVEAMQKESIENENNEIKLK